MHNQTKEIAYKDIPLTSKIMYILVPEKFSMSRKKANSTMGCTEKHQRGCIL
jgi:hypothetical protein